MRARHRLSKLLLRRELYFPGPGKPWSQQHREWLDRLRFEDRASEVVFSDYLEAQDLLLTRRDRLERELAGLAEASPWAVTIGNLRALRGIDTLSAAGLCAEVGEFERFEPEQLASYLGLVPSEESSGPERRQGQITKAGSKHARRLLVEAAWHYRHRPYVSEKLRRRQRGWRARRRGRSAAVRAAVGLLLPIRAPCRSPGKPSGGSAAAGATWPAGAANARPRSRSRSPASSRPSAGRWRRSPETKPIHGCRGAHGKAVRATDEALDGAMGSCLSGGGARS